MIDCRRSHYNKTQTNDPLGEAQKYIETFRAFIGDLPGYQPTGIRIPEREPLPAVIALFPEAVVGGDDTFYEVYFEMFA